MFAVNTYCSSDGTLIWDNDNWLISVTASDPVATERMLDLDLDNDGDLDADDDEEENDANSLGRVIMANTDQDLTENDRAETSVYAWVDSLTPEDASQPIEIDVYLMGASELEAWSSATGGTELPFGEDSEPLDGRIDVDKRLVTLTEATTSYEQTLFVEAIAYDEDRLTLTLSADVLNSSPWGSDNAYYTTLKIDALAMAFNHDPANSGTDGLNMRQHATGPEYIAPEWYSGPTLTPTGNDGTANQKGVLYLSGKTVTVFNRIAVDPKYAGQIVIKLKAVGKDGSSALSIGDLNEIAFSVNSSGVLEPLGGETTDSVNGIDGFVQFATSGTTAASVKQENATFTWEVSWLGKSQTEGNASGSNEAVVTDPIKMYTILNEPGDPWDVTDTTADDKQQPWATVLNVVTATGSTIEWGGGATTVEEVAARVTRAINYSNRFYYDPSAYYVKPPVTPTYFDLTAFVNQLTGAGGPHEANCWDLAWGVVYFSNITGDTLHAMRIAPTPPATTFTTYEILGIGATQWRTWNWNFHAVAWRGGTSSGTVYDACLMLDIDSDPATQPPRTAFLPAGMASANYLSKLTSDTVVLAGFMASLPAN